MMAAQTKNLMHFITAMAVVADFHRAFPARITGDLSPRTYKDYTIIVSNCQVPDQKNGYTKPFTKSATNYSDAQYMLIFVF